MKSVKFKSRPQESNLDLILRNDSQPKCSCYADVEVSVAQGDGHGAVSRQRVSEVDSLVIAAFSSVLSVALLGTEQCCEKLVIVDNMSRNAVVSFIEMIYTGTIQCDKSIASDVADILAALGVTSGGIHLSDSSNGRALVWDEIFPAKKQISSSEAVLVENDASVGVRIQVDHAVTSEVKRETEVERDLAHCDDDAGEVLSPAVSETEEPKLNGSFRKPAVLTDARTSAERVGRRRTRLKQQQRRSAAQIEKRKTRSDLVNAVKDEDEIIEQSAVATSAEESREPRTEVLRERNKLRGRRKRTSPIVASGGENVNVSGRGRANAKRLGKVQLQENLNVSCANSKRDRQVQLRSKLRVGNKTISIAHLRETTGVREKLTPAKDSVPVKCDRCNSQFSKESRLLCHLNSMHPSCEFCYLTFDSKVEFLEHRQATHPEVLTSKPDAAFACLFCDERFVNSKLNTMHMRERHGDRCVTCDQCSRLYPSEKDLTQHVKLFHGPDVWCEECGVNVKGSNWRFHQKRHDPDLPLTEALNCKVCRKQFRAKSTFARHDCMLPKRTFSCDICNKEFNSRAGLFIHSNAHSDRVHQCQTCGKTFANRYSLNAHQILHDEKRWCCNVCGKRFHQKGNMVEHIKSHTGVKDYSCPHCDYKAYKPHRLRNHMRTHTGEKPFQCATCGKHFSTSETLRQHVTTHQDKRPHSCSYCGKRFRTPIRTREHERIHTGEKPFTCDFCGMKHRTSDLLYHHMKTHNKHQQQSVGRGEKTGGITKSEARVKSGVKVEATRDGVVSNNENDNAQSVASASLPFVATQSNTFPTQNETY